MSYFSSTFVEDWIVYEQVVGDNSVNVFQEACSRVIEFKDWSDDNFLAMTSLPF